MGMHGVGSFSSSLLPLYTLELFLSWEVVRVLEGNYRCINDLSSPYPPINTLSGPG